MLVPIEYMKYTLNEAILAEEISDIELEVANKLIKKAINEYNSIKKHLLNCRCFLIENSRV